MLIKNIISTKPFIKKIISFDQIDSQSDTRCAKDIFSKEDVDGGLVGGASLKAEDFLAIVNSI